MRRSVVLCVAVLFFMSAALGHAQDEKFAAAQLEAMKKLDWWVGRWKGEGWAEMVPGQRGTFTITESIQSKVDGLVLLVEGIGKSRIPGKEQEIVVHNAFGVLHYDPKTQRYLFKAWRMPGAIHTDVEVKTTDRGLEWGFELPQGGGLRFSMKLNDRGEWFEFGEISHDRKNWRKFHEMTLQRVK
jgi:hypothetical protein